MSYNQQNDASSYNPPFSYHSQPLSYPQNQPLFYPQNQPLPPSHKYPEHQGIWSANQHRRGNPSSGNNTQVAQFRKDSAMPGPHIFQSNQFLGNVSQNSFNATVFGGAGPGLADNGVNRFSNTYPYYEDGPLERVGTSYEPPRRQRGFNTHVPDDLRRKKEAYKNGDIAYPGGYTSGVGATAALSTQREGRGSWSSPLGTDMEQHIFKAEPVDASIHTITPQETAENPAGTSPEPQLIRITVEEWYQCLKNGRLTVGCPSAPIQLQIEYRPPSHQSAPPPASYAHCHCRFCVRLEFS